MPEEATPATESTPTPETTSPAPESAPATETASEEKPSTYPVEEPAEEKPSYAARSSYKGQQFDMTQDQLDQVVHYGLSALEQQRQEGGQQTQQSADDDDPDEKWSSLNKEIQGLKQQLNASTYESRVQSETQRINKAIDEEVGKHEVFKDNPDLADLGRKSALALLNHNPRMTEAQVMKKVASDFGKALNSKKEQWIRGKVADSQASEAGPGGEPTASPGPKPLTGKDLMTGRVRDSAIARMTNRRLTQ